MKLHDLKPDAGSTRAKTRVGRGIAAGKGKTAGRGTKGTGARTGGGKRQYFEGGQLPLVRRLPFKRGFTNLFRIEYQEVNLADLNEMFDANASVGPAELAAVRLVREADQPVVVLGNGEMSKPLNVSAHRISRSAQAKLEAAGGTFTPLELLVTGAAATIKKLPRAKLDALRAAQSPTDAASE